VGISSGLTTFKHYNHGMLGEWSKLHLMPWIASTTTRRRFHSIFPNS
jgi:hypothetical protein